MERRDFLKFGAVAAAGFSLGMISTGCAENARSDDTSEFTSQKHSFLIEQDSLAKINPETHVTESLSPLMVYGVDTEFIDPYYPLILNSQLVEKISQKREINVCAESPDEITKKVYKGEFAGNYPMDSFMDTQLLGFSDMIDVGAESVSSIFQFNKLNLDVEFFYPELNQASYVRKNVSFQDSIIADKVLQKNPPAIELFGWRFQIRGPDFDFLGKCVRQKVSHVHLEIFHNGPYVANFHIGAYRENKKRCFVLWNNKKPYDICWKTCSPNKKNLVEMMKWVVVAVAAAIGVWITALIVAAIAEALAIALLPVLAVI